MENSFMNFIIFFFSPVIRHQYNLIKGAYNYPELSGKTKPVNISTIDQSLQANL